MFDIKMRDQRGGSLIEFAIVSPLLFVILFGIIEFGILLYDKAMITNASREGARAGIVFDTALRNEDHSVNTGAVIATADQVVRDYCADNLISFGSGSVLDVQVIPGSAAGEPLTVIVGYPFHFLAFSNVIALIGGGLENLVNLRAETVMRLE